MKKIYSILIILIACTIISCNDSSGSGSSEGYIDPGLTTPKPVSNKYWNISPAGQTCGPLKTCNAVIYQGNSQIGIAIDNGSSFNLKIYWTGNFGIGTHSPNNCTIKVRSGATEDFITTNNITITIAQHASEEGVFIITFTIPSVTIAGVTIASGTIHAYKY